MVVVEGGPRKGKDFFTRRIPQLHAVLCLIVLLGRRKYFEDITFVLLLFCVASRRRRRRRRKDETNTHHTQSHTHKKTRERKTRERRSKDCLQCGTADVYTKRLDWSWRAAGQSTSSVVKANKLCSSSAWAILEPPTSAFDVKTKPDIWTWTYKNVCVCVCV